MEGPDVELLERAASAWREIDSTGDIRFRFRDDGMAEFSVVSSLFEGLDSFDREALVWPALRNLPGALLVRLTYSLLLTPSEAARYFAGGAPDGRNGI